LLVVDSARSGSARGDRALRTQVAVYLNEGEDHFNGYRDGDALHKVYEYELSGTPDPEAIAGQAFRMFNAPEECLVDDERQHAMRYRAGQNRSLSVGDVVVVGEVALAVARAGFDSMSISSEQVQTSDRARAATARSRDLPAREWHLATDIRRYGQVEQLRATAPPGIGL
jgi:hypothetical protein